MGADLDAESLTCLPQREVMRSLGFDLVAETHTTRHVTWHGHGISLCLDPQREITPAQAASAIVTEAVNHGARGLSKSIVSALRLR